MCVALPGIVKGIKEGEAEVNFNGNTVWAKTGLVDVKIGDYVLVHAGCVLQKMNADEAEELNELFAEISEDFQK